jgi:hypothetical protein
MMKKHLSKLSTLILGTSLAATALSGASGELQKVMKSPPGSFRKKWCI